MRCADTHHFDSRPSSAPTRELHGSFSTYPRTERVRLVNVLIQDDLEERVLGFHATGRLCRSRAPPTLPVLRPAPAARSDPSLELDPPPSGRPRSGGLSCALVAVRHMSTSSSHPPLPSSSTISSAHPKRDARPAPRNVAAALNPLACLGYREPVAIRQPPSGTSPSIRVTPLVISRERTGSTAESSAPPQTPTSPSASSLASFVGNHRGPLASIRNKLRTRSSTGSLRLSPTMSGVRPATVTISHPRPLRPRLCSSSSSSAVPLSPPVLPLPPLRTLQKLDTLGEFGELGGHPAGSASFGSSPSRRAPSLIEGGGQDLPSLAHAGESGPHPRCSIYSTVRSTVSSNAGSSRGSAAVNKWPTLMKRRCDRLDEDWQWVSVSRCGHLL